MGNVLTDRFTEVEQAEVIRDHAAVLTQSLGKRFLRGNQ